MRNFIFIIHSVLFSGKNRAVKYSLLDSADGHFAIDTNEGILLLAKALDREQTDKYTLVVGAVDGGSPSLSAKTIVVITVAG